MGKMSVQRDSRSRSRSLARSPQEDGPEQRIDGVDGRVSSLCDSILSDCCQEDQSAADHQRYMNAPAELRKELRSFEMLYQAAKDENELLEFKNYELLFRIQELEQKQRGAVDEKNGEGRQLDCDGQVVGGVEELSCAIGSNLELINSTTTTTASGHCQPDRTTFSSADKQPDGTEVSYSGQVLVLRHHFRLFCIGELF